MPLSGNGGDRGGRGHATMPFPSAASGEYLELVGHGVMVRYSEGHLEVSWESGDQMTMRSPERRIAARVDPVHMADISVMLKLKLKVPVPEPWFSEVEIVLAFPGSLDAKVRQLAAWLNGDREAGGPPAAAGKPDPAPPMPPAAPRPDPWNPTADEPVRAQAHDRPPAPAHNGHPAELPWVVFRADLTAWTDDPDWICLIPTFETARLVKERPLRQSHEAVPHRQPNPA